MYTIIYVGNFAVYDTDFLCSYHNSLHCTAFFISIGTLVSLSRLCFFSWLCIGMGSGHSANSSIIREEMKCGSSRKLTEEFCSGMMLFKLICFKKWVNVFISTLNFPELFYLYICHMMAIFFLNLYLIYFPRGFKFAHNINFLMKLLKNRNALIGIFFLFFVTHR